MPDLVIQPQRTPLRGSVPCPPDAEVAGLAFVVGALAESTCAITVRHLPQRPLFAALGEPTAVGWRVKGPLPAANEPSACPLTVAGLAGALAGTMTGRVEVAPNVCRKALARLAATLRRRGGRIEGILDPNRPGEVEPPLAIEATPLCLLQHELGPGDSVSKTAALLSGLSADGPTELTEPLASWDGCERLLMAVGVDVRAGGPVTRIEPAVIAPFDVTIPGDPGLAAYLLAAGALVADSHVGVRSVGVGSSRSGWSAALSNRGVAMRITPTLDCAGEPCGDVWLQRTGTALRGADLSGELAWRSGWRLPVWAALAAVSEGGQRISDLAPRFDGWGGLDACITMLRAFGIDAGRVEGNGDGGLDVVGGVPRATTIESNGDPHVAMAAAVLALAGDGPTRIVNAQCIVDAFPRFVASLRALGAHITVS